MYGTNALGELTHRQIERFLGRRAFMEAVNRVAPEAIADVERSLVPLIRLLNTRSQEFGKTSYVFALITTIGETSVGEELRHLGSWRELRKVGVLPMSSDFWSLMVEGTQPRTMFDWLQEHPGTLEQGSALARDPEIKELAAGISGWLARWGLDEDWVGESLYTSLIAACHPDKPRFVMVYPGSYGFGDETHPLCSVSGVGENELLIRFTARTLEAQRPQVPSLSMWNPVAEPWAAYSQRATDRLRESLDKYRREQEAEFLKLGFRRRRIKRGRSGSRANHFDWLVLSQVLGLSLAEIANRNALAEVTEQAIQKAIQEVASTISMRRRR